MHRLVIALVTLIGLTAATFVAGYLFLFSASTDRAAAMAPANSAFYVNVYLQPSAGQQMNLSGLIGRLPGFADDASLDEKVDQVVQNLLAGTGIDYREQVKPWLGNQIAVTGWPGNDGGASATLAIIGEVTDPEAARVAIAGIVGESEAQLRPETYAGVELQVSDAGAYAFIGDDMVVIGQNADAVRAVIDVQEGGESLADRADFVATMEALEPDHLASAFIDLAALAESTGMADQVSGVSTAGAVLVAEPEGLRLSASAPFDRDEATPSDAAGFALGGEPSSLVDWMPSDTIAEAVIFGLGQTLEDAEAALGVAPEGEEVVSALDTIRALAAFAFGIDLDADLLPLLDREVAVAVRGIEGGLPAGQIMLRPSDPAAAAAALERVASALSGAGAARTTETIGDVEVTVLALPDTGEVAYAEVDGIVIMGFGVADVAAAIEAHASGESLGTNERYTTTFEVAGGRAGTEAFVDVGAVVELLGDPIELPDDARDILLQVGTLGITAPSRDHQIEFHAVLTIDE
jgi:hypothetical protein